MLVTPEIAWLRLGVTVPVDAIDVTAENWITSPAVGELTEVVELTPDKAIETFGETELTDVVELTPVSAANCDVTAVTVPVEVVLVTPEIA